MDDGGELVVTDKTFVRQEAKESTSSTHSTGETKIGLQVTLT